MIRGDHGWSRGPRAGGAGLEAAGGGGVGGDASGEGALGVEPGDGGHDPRGDGSRPLRHGQAESPRPAGPDLRGRSRPVGVCVSVPLCLCLCLCLGLGLVGLVCLGFGS